VDLVAVFQTLALLTLTTVFSVGGHEGMWLPSVAIAIALSTVFVWLTAIVWKALDSESGRAIAQ
jgi:hypothetical protein